MKKILLCFTVFALILATSCYREPNNPLLQEKGKSQTSLLQLLQQIDSLSSLGEFDPAISKDYIAQTEEFCEINPEDPMAAEFLYKGGLLAMTVAKSSGDPGETQQYSQKALTIFDNILKIYPDFNGVKNCILNKGVVYDDILHDYENAEMYYREFIARFPNDSLAIKLEPYLQYIGKSPEEIMASFGKSKK
jgi:tetratricopeptide (TPR) repeat protein